MLPPNCLCAKTRWSSRVGCDGAGVERQDIIERQHPVDIQLPALPVDDVDLLPPLLAQHEHANTGLEDALLAHAHQGVVAPREPRLEREFRRAVTVAPR